MSHHDERGSDPNGGGGAYHADEELDGTQRTVASKASLKDERDPSFHPQSGSEALQKISQESQGEGVVGTAKKMLEEVDRQVGGEYERREEGSSAAAADGPAVAGHDAGGGTPEPRVARAQVEAEQERFDGLVNEPANPPREPDLERTS